ncbi:MAG: hypothetical protein ACUZ77_07830 [Candidatus Brocadiales bacterium]
MATITFTIPDAKLQRVVDAIKGRYSIPQVLVDPDNPGLGYEDEFTPQQWAKEWIRQRIITEVVEWEQAEARKTVSVARDNDLVQ